MDPLGNYTHLHNTRQKPELIGAKDILLLKILNERLETLNNKCELTFKDGIKAACELTLNELIDIFKNKAFTGQLQGVVPDREHMKRWYRAQPVPAYAVAPNLDEMNDRVIRWLYKEAKKKSQVEAVETVGRS